MMSHAIRALGIVLPIILATVSIATAQTPTTAPSATTSPSQITAIASIEAFWSAELYAKTSGYVGEVKADIGDRVTKGQLLATLDVPELATELTAAQAMLVAKQEMAKASEAMVQQAQTGLEVTKRQAEGAAAEAKLSETTLQRQEQLYAQKAATTQQIDDSRAKSEVSRAATSVAQAKIAAAEADLKAAQANSAVAKANAQVAAAEVQKVQALIAYTKIGAPFDGVVTRRMINPGDLVQAATASRTTAMFTVQSIDIVRVMCDVPESSATAVRVGDAAEIKLFGPNGQTIHGAVTRIATAMNTATRTMRAEIDLENPQEKLRPGMYAQVIITPGQKPVAATQP